MIMTSSPKISVALATRNEAENLPRLLRSLKGLVDEVVVADAGSTDDTLLLLQQYGARVIQVPHVPMFHRNKQTAIDACTGDWVLMMDADEELSPELREQITRLVRNYRTPVLSASEKKLFEKHARVAEEKNKVRYLLELNKPADAYFIPRLNFFLGGFLRHGGVYPDSVIRLFQRGAASWPCKTVHEQMKVRGTVGFLSGNLYHYSDPTVRRYWMRANRYTSETALHLKEQMSKVSVTTAFSFLILQPIRTFCSLYFRHKGFMDGVPGFFWALFSSLHHPIAFLKSLELRRV